MSTQPKTFLTPEEYLEIERKAEVRSEYYCGEMFAMAGAQEGHNLIIGNVSGQLRRQLQPRGCRTFTNEMRVQVRPVGLYTYPDVVVVCEEPQYADAHVDTLLNPTFLIEVLSPSTEAYDRGLKFELYQSLPSLREYLMISSARMRTELFTRSSDNQWRLTVNTGENDVLELISVDCRIELREMYQQVRFSPDALPRPPIRS